MPDTTHEFDWKSVEEIASLLEKSLSPSAIVKHNVRLPVIGKPQRKPRQCDIVIIQGTPPRQTVTIAEVQKRKRKPDINTFHGWIKKMREVGAQHLICVSMLGYPKSIIDAVKTEYGPTVRLLTLEELKQPGFSTLNFIAPHILHKTPHIIFEEIGTIRLENLPPRAEIPLRGSDAINYRTFELENFDKRLALTDLMNIVFREKSYEWSEEHQSETASYKLELDLSEGKDLWIYLDNKRYKVRKLPVRVNIENNFHEIPLTCYQYQQEFNDGVLAWVASANGSINGEDIDIKLVFKPDDTGFLQLSTIQQTGAQYLDIFLSTDRTALTSFVTNHYHKRNPKE